MTAAPSRIFGEGTSFDVSAHTSFRGDDSRLYLQPGSHLEPDEYGVTVLTRKWKCRADLVESFLPQPGDADFRYRDLKFWKHSIDEDGPIATLTTVFNGFLGGFLGQSNSKEFVEHDSQIQEVAVAMSQGQGQGQLVVVYVGPNVTTRWATSVKPPANERIHNKPDGTCRLLTLRGQNGVELRNFNGSTAITAQFGVYPKEIRTRYTRVQQGGIWMCTETVERVLTQISDSIQI